MFLLLWMAAVVALPFYLPTVVQAKKVSLQRQSLAVKKHLKRLNKPSIKMIQVCSSHPPHTYFCFLFWWVDQVFSFSEPRWRYYRLCSHLSSTSFRSPIPQKPHNSGSSFFPFPFSHAEREREMDDEFYLDFSDETYLPPRRSLRSEQGKKPRFRFWFYTDADVAFEWEVPRGHHTHP